MLKRKWVMGAIVASALGAIPVVASAAIYVDIAPPEPRHEVVPAPRAGYVWAPGYYNYRNGRTSGSAATGSASAMASIGIRATGSREKGATSS
jgi:hypothetical protein